jgi:hypothetical protein
MSEETKICKCTSHIGQGIGFAALCFAAAWMECQGIHSPGLWVLIVVWAVLGF